MTRVKAGRAVGAVPPGRLREPRRPPCPRCGDAGHLHAGNRRGRRRRTGRSTRRSRVPATGYAYHVIPPETAGEWIRAEGRPRPEVGHGLLPLLVRQPGRRSGDVPEPAGRGPGREAIRGHPPAGHGRRHAAATWRQRSWMNPARPLESGYYVMGDRPAAAPVRDAAGGEGAARRNGATKQDFEVDAASVIMKDTKGNRYRLPKGPDALDRPVRLGMAPGHPRDRHRAQP